MHLLVVAVMEGAVGDAEECLCLGIVAVLAIALKQGQSCEEVSLLEEVGSVWQFHLLLRTVSTGSERSGGWACMLTCFWAI